MEEEESKRAAFKIDEDSQNDSLESISDDSDNFGNSDNEEPLNNNGVCSSKMRKMIRDWEDYMSGQRTEQPSSSSSAWNGNNNNNSMADIEGIISKETSIYTHPNSQNALLGPEDLDVNLDLVNIDIDPNNIDLDGDLNLNTGIGDGDLDSDMKMDDLPDFIPSSDRKLIYPLYTDDIPYVRPKKYFGYEPSCTVTSSALGEIYENVDIFKDDQIKAITAEITGQCTIQPIGLPLDIVKLTDTPPVKKESTEKSAPAPMKSVDGFLVPAPVKKRRIKVKDPASLLPKPLPPQLPPQLPPPLPSSDPWATEIIPIPLKPQQEGQNRTQGYKRKISHKNTSVIKQILNGPPNNGEEPDEPTLGIRDYHRDAHTLLSTIRLAPNPQRYVEPYVPQYLDPFRARNVEPYRPRDVEPYRPRDVEPYRSRNIEPYRPRNVESYRPRNVEPYRPRIEPAYDPANFGFPSTSYGFSPATSEGFNNAASQAFYNPLAGFDHNPYNPTQYSIFGNYPQPSENNKRKSSGIIKYADGCVVRSPFDLPRASNEPPVPTFNYFSEPYDKIIKRGNKVVGTSAYSDQQKYPDKDHYKKGKDSKK